MNKDNYSIKQIRSSEKMRLTNTVTLGIIGGILLSCITCEIIPKKKKETHEYSIDYGTVKVSGEFFETFDKSNIKVLNTTNDGYRIVIEDSNHNYWIIDEGCWYTIYSNKDGKYSLISESGYVVCGTIETLNKYLNAEEVKQKSFHLDELKNIENRINNKESEIQLKRTI